MGAERLSAIADKVKIPSLSAVLQASASSGGVFAAIATFLQFDCGGASGSANLCWRGYQTENARRCAAGERDRQRG
jgi:hypothetical protein